MKANEMEPRPRDEGGQSLQEFQWGHDDMCGPIAIRRFQLKHDLAGRCAAQPFVAQGGTSNIATETFEGRPLMRTALQLFLFPVY